jgi:hypothetical protein
VVAAHVLHQKSSHECAEQIRPADAEVRRQLNRTVEGRRMKGSTNLAMMLQYVIAKALEGQELNKDIIG